MFAAVGNKGRRGGALVESQEDELKGEGEAMKRATEVSQGSSLLKCVSKDGGRRGERRQESGAM